MVVALATAYLYGHHVGWIAGQWELTRDRYTYTDVLVVERHDAQDFTLQPARMAPWNAHICQEVDWAPQEMMRVLTYQQRRGCKDVSGPGAFVFYTEHGRRIKFREETGNAGY